MEKFLFLFLVNAMLASCSHKLSYGLRFNSVDSVYIKNFDKQSVEMTIYNVIKSNNGIFSIYHQFSFDKRIKINLENSKIIYKEFSIQMNFIGEYLHKESMSLKGTGGVTTIFHIPFQVKGGDTLILKLDDFLSDESGKKYLFDPIYLIVKEKATKAR